VSGVLSLAKPQRIKASHRRRWKGTTGHSVYIMNNPLSGTDPTGYMSSICSIGSNENARGCSITEVNPSSPSASDGRKAGNGGKKENGAPGQKSTLAQKIDEYGKRINKYLNIDQDRVTSGKLNDRARMIAEGDLIGGSNENNQTPEKQELLRNLHTSAVVAEISGNVAKDQATDPLNYAGPAFKLLAGIKILMVAVKLEKAEDVGTIVLKGSRNPKVAEAAALGRLKHKEWDPGAGFKKEVRLPSGKQADAVNYQTREVVELKPNNTNAIRRGEKQVEGYRKELESVTGECWTCRVETYDK
jgi:hypothetical protein